MYEGDYDRRNPGYKFASYLSEIRPFIKPHGTLLDIGCAYGSFLKKAVKSFKASGTDISGHAIEIAQQRVSDAVKIWQSDVLQLPVTTQYDSITCFDILEHVPDLEQALKHIRQMLNSNGVLTLTIPVYDTYTGKIVSRLDKDPTHVHKQSRYWWLELLEKEGYEILTWKGIWRYYFKNIFYLHYMSRLTRGFTPAIMIIARKKSD